MPLPFFRVVLLLLLVPEAPASAADYLHDVKPLLARKCYACHGALKQQSGLRVDTAVALLQGGDSGSPVVRGEPAASLLMDVLTGDAGFRMPPEGQGSPLTQAELQLLREWIAAGAPAPDNEQPQTDPASWWSYQPLRRPDAPAVHEKEWCRQPLDQFVAAQRETLRLPHTEQAPKAIWLRRVFLDLIGLPPTREELHRFLSDDSDSAYERVVDDLLARPQYGERWGRHWMDIWRYSDWYGSRGGNEIRYSQRHLWRWRDWIVRSLNEDQGYDQMVREMLAGDELAGEDLAALPATGFLGRNWYKFDRDVWLFETVERSGEAFLGLTLRCCRCHDHKFDPITQEEYYRFRAFFEPHDVRTDPISALTGVQKDASLGEVPADGVALAYDKSPDAPTYLLQRGDSRFPDKSKPLTPSVPAALGGEPLRITPIELSPLVWNPVLRPQLRASLLTKAQAAVAEATRLRDAATTAAAAARQAAAAARTADAPATTAERPFLHDDFSQPRPEVWTTLSGQWRYQNNTLMQTEVSNFATIVTRENHPHDFRVRLRYRPLRTGGYRSVGFSFDYQDQGDCQDVYTSTGDAKQSVQAFHRIAGRQVYPQEGIAPAELRVAEEATLEVVVQGSHLTIDLNGKRRLDYELPIQRRTGRFALWVHDGTAEFRELQINELPPSLEALEVAAAAADQAAELAQLALRAAEAERQSVELRLSASVAEFLEADPEQASRLARRAFAAEKRADLLRAEFEAAQLRHGGARPDADDALSTANEKLEQARRAAEQPATESYTPLGARYPATSTGRRAALAAWIASGANPRTARVAANHLWSRHFGQPLVTTPENFGLNGRPPTHPQLLDWLAAELIANGWRMKPLHRQIVLSSTYRMASAVGAAESAWKTDPDNALLWRMNSRRLEAEAIRDSVLFLAGRLDLQLGGPEFPETQGETQLRRSLYFRNTPNEKMPLLEVFDMADPNSCYLRRESVVPHQALALMNSGLTLDHAKIIAERLASSHADFVVAAFETILCRPPTDKEAARCREFLARHDAASLTRDPETYPDGGSATRSPSADQRQRAKEDLIHVLLQHNDFVTIR